MLDPYYVLGVALNATPAQIRAAYRRRAAECHPDRYPPEQRTAASERMIELNAARDLLLDARRRAEYDERMRLEMHKAMWRAKSHNPYAPRQPGGDIYVGRRRRFVSPGTVFIVAVLLIASLPLLFLLLGLTGGGYGEMFAWLELLVRFFFNMLGAVFFTLALAALLSGLSRFLKH